MYISRLALDHFRSWRHCLIDLQPGVNILQGSNGLGKTNIVESVIVLSTGSSHRSSSSLPLVERGEKTATIRANVVETPAVKAAEDGDRDCGNEDSSDKESTGQKANKLTSYEVTIAARGANRARINGGNSLYMRDVVGLVPSISFTPEDQRLIAGEPAGRRNFLDQAGSQLIAGYWQELQQFDRIAKQRAVLLKQLSDMETPLDGQLSGLEIWTGQFIEAGVALTKSRALLVERLAGPFTRIYDQLVGSLQHAGLTYRPSFEEVFAADEPNMEISRHFQRIYPGELARGQNLIGPQRDDVEVVLGGMPARDFASNGEMWTLALALKMALFQEIADSQGSRPIVILDDVFAQLDQNRREQILDFAQGQDQVLITVAAASDIPLKEEANIIDVAALKAQDDLDKEESAAFERQIQALRTERSGGAGQAEPGEGRPAGAHGGVAG
ncbi:DNA replication and repair protein RecF [Bifidobacterium aemilianum]|uniref:DNA replication and repair protein RecF n=1 Tax=Bifidobacterium aemilianum TaxID=2493120 RepID=A0A366K7N8_9BIFI|nr:DNA replication and repair protein RecF [Bifidobacterium aemilianum]RBP97760.1 DNA replication and repair protein RecF [Bifidobacterium aemilianum]